MSIKNAIYAKFRTPVRRTVLYVKNADYAHVYNETEFLYTAERETYDNFIIMATNCPTDYYVSDVIIDGVGDCWVVYKDIDEPQTHYISKMPKSVVISMELKA